MFIWSSEHEVFFNANKIVAFWYDEKFWVCEVEGLDFRVCLTPEEFKRHLLPRINRQ